MDEPLWKSLDFSTFLTFSFYSLKMLFYFPENVKHILLADLAKYKNMEKFHYKNMEKFQIFDFTKRIFYLTFIIAPLSGTFVERAMRISLKL